MTVKVKDHPNESLVPFPPHAELVAPANHAAALADDPLAAWITAQLLLDAGSRPPWAGRTLPDAGAWIAGRPSLGA